MSNTSATTEFKPGHPWRWQPGQSGNPAGVPKARREFETAFFAALIGEGTPKEAAQILWKAARNSEAWAVQTLLQKLAPTTQSLHLIHEKGEDNDEFDFSQLTDEEFAQVSKIMERLEGEKRLLEGGRRTQESE